MKLRLSLLLTLLVGLFVLAPTAAHAQALLFDWVGYDFEGPNPNPAIFGEAGSSYTPVGFVNGLFAPLAADTVTTLKSAVKELARERGMQATFMPKPRSDAAGSGMHTHQVLGDRAGRSVFDGPAEPDGLARIATASLRGRR